MTAGSQRWNIGSDYGQGGPTRGIP
jgi:hypothetical protein